MKSKFSSMSLKFWCLAASSVVVCLSGISASAQTNWDGYGDEPNPQVVEDNAAKGYIGGILAKLKPAIPELEQIHAALTRADPTATAQDDEAAKAAIFADYFLKHVNKYAEFDLNIRVDYDAPGFYPGVWVDDLNRFLTSAGENQYVDKIYILQGLKYNPYFFPRSGTNFAMQMGPMTGWQYAATSEQKALVEKHDNLSSFLLQWGASHKQAIMKALVEKYRSNPQGVSNSIVPFETIPPMDFMFSLPEMTQQYSKFLKDHDAELRRLRIPSQYYMMGIKDRVRRHQFLFYAVLSFYESPRYRRDLPYPADPDLQRFVEDLSILIQKKGTSLTLRELQQVTRTTAYTNEMLGVIKGTLPRPIQLKSSRVSCEKVH